MSYSLTDYCDMIGDSVRMNAYRNALKRLITPDSTVLDIGCGTGVFCMLACKFGARHVYGIEPDNSVKVAEKLMAANGFDDRSTFYNKISEDVSLPEKVDIIVSDLRGALPFFGNHFQIIDDARERFLKPGGKLIPQMDQLYMVPLSDSKLYNSTVYSWLNSFEAGLDFSRLTDMFRDQWQCATIKHKAVAGEPALWTTLNYTEKLPAKIEKEATWTYDKRVTLHGLGVWFDCRHWDDIGFSASPFAEKQPKVYGNAFFPFKSPLSMMPGDTVSVKLSAHQLASDVVISWSTKHVQGNTVDEFKQTSMNAEIPTADTLRRRADNYAPGLSVYGNIELRILEGMKAGQTLGVIARDLADRFPKQFPTWHKALTHVGAIASAYDKPRD